MCLPLFKNLFISSIRCIRLLSSESFNPVNSDSDILEYLKMSNRIYIETSIPSFYFTERKSPDAIARKNWTRQWW